MKNNREQQKHWLRIVTLSSLLVYYSVIIVLYIINTISGHA